MIFKLFMAVLVFLLIVSLVGAIYLGWEETSRKYEEQNRSR